MKMMKPRERAYLASMRRRSAGDGVCMRDVDNGRKERRRREKTRKRMRRDKRKRKSKGEEVHQGCLLISRTMSDEIFENELSNGRLFPEKEHERQ